MAGKLYVGVTPGKREIFRSNVTPTTETHGDRFNMAIGPFRTRRGAEWMADPVKGMANPHCRNVADAERLAKKYSKRSDDGN
jgi:hypothetical protein